MANRFIALRKVRNAANERIVEFDDGARFVRADRTLSQLAREAQAKCPDETVLVNGDVKPTEPAPSLVQRQLNALTAIVGEDKLPGLIVRTMRKQNPDVIGFAAYSAADVQALAAAQLCLEYGLDPDEPEQWIKTKTAPVGDFDAGAAWRNNNESAESEDIGSAPDGARQPARVR